MSIVIELDGFGVTLKHIRRLALVGKFVPAIDGGGRQLFVESDVMLFAHGRKARKARAS